MVLFKLLFPQLLENRIYNQAVFIVLRLRLIIKGPRFASKLALSVDYRLVSQLDGRC